MTITEYLIIFTPLGIDIEYYIYILQIINVPNNFYLVGYEF